MLVPANVKAKYKWNYIIFNYDQLITSSKFHPWKNVLAERFPSQRHKIEIGLGNNLSTLDVLS
jgi:hypothetical protein